MHGSSSNKPGSQLVQTNHAAAQGSDDQICGHGTAGLVQAGELNTLPLQVLPYGRACGAYTAGASL
jgi:hypothetical protein